MKKPHPRDPDYAETKPLWLEHVKIRQRPQVIETVRTVERVKQVPGPERVVFRDRVIEPDMTKIEAAVERLRKAREMVKAPTQELTPEIADMLAEHGLSVDDTYERINERLLPSYRLATSYSEMAIEDGRNGHMAGHPRMYWIKKAERIGSGIKWNRGRSAETV